MLKKCLYQIPKHYDRIEVFEGSVKYLSQLLSLRKVFNFQPNVCNGSHDLLMMSIDLSDIKTANYCCIFNGISKSEAKNLMQNIDLPTEKPGTLWNKKLFCNI